LSTCLDRRNPETTVTGVEPFADRSGGWLDMTEAARDPHPTILSCMPFNQRNAVLGQVEMTAPRADNQLRRDVMLMRWRIGRDGYCGKV